jgi:hypothetical protein
LTFDHPALDRISFIGTLMFFALLVEGEAALVLYAVNISVSIPD